MTESERYEKEIADLEDRNKYLVACNEWLNTENNELKNTKAELEDDNRHLAERVELLEHKRNELLDELKRVGGDKERDIVVGQLMAYRQMFRMILDCGKE
jgi:hypothetical protein